MISKSLDLDPLTIAFYRGLFAGLALLPFVSRTASGGPAGALAAWREEEGHAAAMTGAFFLGSVKTTTSANAIFLQCTATFWVVPVGAIFLGERPDRRARVSIALAMLGIVAIVGWGYDGRPNEWQGIVLGLASGITYACIAVGLRGLRDLDPIWLSAVLNLVGSATLGIWARVSGQGLASPSRLQVLVLIGFGMSPDGDPLYALFARGLREIGALPRPA